jgi:hypothetical protein
MPFAPSLGRSALNNMELQEALAKAGQILDEERAAPTVSYVPNGKELVGPDAGPNASSLESIAVLTAGIQLSTIRLQRPRPLQENPRVWTFKSINYNLLCALHAQLSIGSRPGFVKGILQRMASPSCGVAKLTTSQPRWNAFVSELPLIAEFCVRNGATKTFLSVLAEIKTSPGQAVLLQHLEDMIALNFTVFSDAEYSQLRLCIQGTFGDWLQCYTNSLQTAITQEWAGKSVALSGLLFEVREANEGILEECRKAQYLYLKGSLLDGLNIEINQDKDAVQSYLQRLGFTEPLTKCLDQAERLYHEGGSGFDLKASMGHLRSFLEGLHKDAFPMLLAKFGGAAPKKWGDGLLYLRENGVLSKPEEQFAASLYTLISDEAVHPLMAEREYARLFRNVVIEYALLLLWKLEKLGAKR